MRQTPSGDSEERGRRHSFAAITVLAVTLGFTSNVLAIPAFARKYKTSCQTCHDVFPRVNAFGEAFRLHGFRFPTGDEEQRKEEPVPVGAEGNKRVFPKALWPSDIPGSLPLAFRNRTSYQFTPRDDRTLRTLLWEWELIAAGTLGDDVSFFGHANWETESGTKSTAETHTKSVAFLHLQNILPNHHLDFKLGIVTEETDLPHIRSHQWITKEKYLKDDGRIPYPATGFDEKDTLRILRRGPGIAAVGFTRRFQYALGYQMGTQEGDSAQSNNGYVQLAYKAGGMDYYGNKPSEATAQPPHIDNSLGLGLFAAVGSSDVKPTGGSRTKDSFWRIGPDAEWRIGGLGLAGGAVFGRNKNPYGSLDGGAVDYRTWLVKGEYFVYPWLLPNVRYEWERFDVPDGLNLGKRERARVVPNVVVLFRQNVRLGLEGVFYTKRRTTPSGAKLDDNSATFYFDFAF